MLSGSGERLETGTSVAVPGGYAVSAIAHSTASEARIFVRTEGQTRDTVVARVFGGGEPPKLAVSGGAIFLSWVDADAGGRGLRLAAVAMEGSGLRVLKVVEVESPFRPQEGVELQARSGRVSIIWDSVGPAPAHAGHVYCALYDSTSLHAIAKPRRVTPATEDASRPTLVAHSGGDWLLWVETLDRPKGSLVQDDFGLVDAPPEQLRLGRLGEDCALLGEPLDVTPKGESIEFDALVDGDTLWVLSKDDGSPGYALRAVDPSGTVTQKGAIEPPQFELPHLVALGGAPWMIARARDGALLLGLIGAEERVALRPEPTLLGAEVLGVTEKGIVAERPRSTGPDGAIPIDVISCGTGAEGLK